MRSTDLRSENPLPERCLLLSGLGSQRRYTSDDHIAVLDQHFADGIVDFERRMHVTRERKLDGKFALLTALGQHADSVARDHTHEARGATLDRDIVRGQVVVQSLWENRKK